MAYHSFFVQVQMGPPDEQGNARRLGARIEHMQSGVVGSARSLAEVADFICACLGADPPSRCLAEEREVASERVAGRA